MSEFTNEKKDGKQYPKKMKVVDPREEEQKVEENEEYKQKSVKVYKKTYDLVEELKFATRANSNIHVYEDAIEFYAKHVLK